MARRGWKWPLIIAGAFVIVIVTVVVVRKTLFHDGPAP